MFRTDAFNQFLQEKQLAENTHRAYSADLQLFVRFCQQKGLESPREIDVKVLEDYFALLTAEGRSSSTIRRIRSCLNRYFAYLHKEAVLGENPLLSIPIAGTEKPVRAEILTQDEVERLLSFDYGNDEKALRDRAILEILYATGLQISTLIELTIDDYEVTRKCLHVEARRIPLYRTADQSLRQYLLRARPYIALPDEKALFVSLQGQKLSRQGLWKILRQRAEEAGIAKSLTPRLLRRSFAVHLAENGAGAEELGKMLGLKDKNAAVSYLKLAQKGDLEEDFMRFHPRAGKRR